MVKNSKDSLYSRILVKSQDKQRCYKTWQRHVETTRGHVHLFTIRNSPYLGAYVRSRHALWLVAKQNRGTLDTYKWFGRNRPPNQLPFDLFVKSKTSVIAFLGCTPAILRLYFVRENYTERLCPWFINTERGVWEVRLWINDFKSSDH